LHGKNVQKMIGSMECPSHDTLLLCNQPAHMQSHHTMELH